MKCCIEDKRKEKKEVKKKKKTKEGGREKEIGESEANCSFNYILYHKNTVLSYMVVCVSFVSTYDVPKCLCVCVNFLFCVDIQMWCVKIRFCVRACAYTDTKMKKGV